MFKDYSGGMILVSGRNRWITARRKNVPVPGELLPAAGLARKAVGAMLLLALAIGIGSTFWYGLQVRVALDQIGSDQRLNQDLSKENKLLLVRRDLLLTSESMAAAAQKLGLVEPAENQLRYR